jgi:hypothetical protein
MIASVGAGFAIRVWQSDAPRGRSLGRLLTYAQLVLIGYGLVRMLLLRPSLSYRRVQAFWPTLVIFGHVLAGLWLGRFFIYLGIAVTALTVAGYFWSDDWYPLRLAAVVGGGLWLRRLG